MCIIFCATILCLLQKALVNGIAVHVWCTVQCDMYYLLTKKISHIAFTSTLNAVYYIPTENDWGKIGNFWGQIVPSYSTRSVEQFSRTFQVNWDAIP